MIRDAAKLSAGTLASMVMLAVRSIVVLEIVGPSTIGVWKSVMVLTTASAFLRFGIPASIALRVPLFTGQGNHEAARRDATAAISLMAPLGLIVGAAIIASSAFVPDPEYQLALRFVAVMILLDFPYKFLRELANARHRFSIRVRETLLAATANLALTLPLAYYFGLAGLGTGAVLAVLLPTTYLWWSLRPSLSRTLEWKRLKQMASVGFPFSILDTAYESMRYLAVIAVAVLLGRTYVGYFALSMLVMDFSVNLAGEGISRVVLPHMLRQYGNTGSLRASADYFRKPIRLISYTLPVLLGLTGLAIPLAVEWFLPSYKPGIEAAQIGLWGVFFLSVHSAVSSFLGAANRINYILKTMLIMAPILALLHFGAVGAGLGLAGAAWAGFISLGLVTGVELFVAIRDCGQSRRQTLTFVLVTYSPLLACIVLNSLVQSVVYQTGAPAIIEVSSKCLLYLALYAPLFFIYEKRFALVRVVRQGYGLA